MRDRKGQRQSELIVDDWERSATFIGPEVAAAARERRLARIRLLWERRALLGRVTAIGILCCIAIAFLISSKYTSTTRLMPPDQEGSPGLGMLAQLFTSSKSGESGGLSGVASNVLGLKTSGALFIGILQSRTVEDALITDFNLRKVYRDRRWEKARSDLESNTNIDDDRKSGIIRISVTDKSPQRAAAMAAAYVTELNRVVTGLNTSSAHRERVFLQGRLQQVQKNLEADEKTFSQFASKNTAIDVPQQGKAMIEAAASLEGQLIAEQTELQSLRSIYTDSNVRVKSMEAQVSALRQQLRQMGGKGAADQAEAGQDDSSLYPSIRELPILGVTYADLYRRTKVQEAVFETLTQEYEMAKVEEAKETPSVKVLDPANIAEKPSSPNRLLIIFGGGGLCLLAAAAWVLGQSKWEQIDPNDPGKMLTQEVFSTTRNQLVTFSHSFAKLRLHKPAADRNGSKPAQDAPSEISGNRSASSVPHPGQQTH
ncbi:MAG: GumC family protein [Candidatus Acidiferrales bacterium]